MRHPATQALYAYWNELRGNRAAPRRLDIQPARIADLLLDTFILERTDGATFRFRLAGTRVATRFGLKPKSQSFLSCWGDGDRALLSHHMVAIAEQGRVGVFTGEADCLDIQGRLREPSSTFEMIVLPLVHSGATVDRLLGHLVELAPGDARPAGSIRRLRLVAAETLSPGRRTPAPATPFTDRSTAVDDRQLPLHPHVRTARIVRQGDRQFRVYEGGQST